MEWHDILSLILAVVGASWVFTHNRRVVRWCRVALARGRARTMHRDGIANGWGMVGPVRYQAHGSYGSGPLAVIVDCPLEPPWLVSWSDQFYSVRLTYHRSSSTVHLTFGFRARHELVEKEAIKRISWAYRGPTSESASGDIYPDGDDQWPVIAQDTAIPLDKENSTILLKAMLEKRSGLFGFTVHGFQARAFNDVGSLDLDKFFATPVQRYIEDWIQREYGEGGLSSADAIPPLFSKGLFISTRGWIGFIITWWLKWATSPTFRKDRREFGWGATRDMIAQSRGFGAHTPYWWESTWWYARFDNRRMRRYIRELERRRADTDDSRSDRE